MEAILHQRFEQAYRQQKPGLMRFIASKVATMEDAEDILQEVFLQAFRSLDVTEPIGNLAGWLYTAARNRVIDWYRRKRKRSRTVSLATNEDSAGIENLLVDSGIHVEEDYIRSLAADALINGIERLPPGQRDVVVLQAIEGHTFREISELTGTSINTLIARKRYALRTLRRRLADLKELLEETRKTQGGEE